MLLYALTILVSAFLLFQVQPVIAKIILPWFGGSAAVWTTCMLFFQLVLLFGYAYAHAVVRYLKPRMQMIVHGALLLVSAIVLPIYPNQSWKPSGTEEPTFAIIALLAATVGLPYFLLSTTGPLLQAWYARRFKGSMPYRLYALSNAGSMFALVSYPFLVEPKLTTHQQAWIWSGAYGVFILLCGFTAFRSGTEAVHHEIEAVDESQRPGIRQYLMWLLLPACASVMLLAITSHLQQNVAAIPFLWMLPLTIYLLTFILCFEGSGWYRRNPYLGLVAVMLGGMALVDSVDATGSVPIKVLVPMFSMGLYTCCMVCHGELARLKPHPKYLTHFFLMISAGGALGGLFVGLVAPHFFKALYELQIGLAATAVITVAALRGDSEYKWLSALLDWPKLLASVVLLAVWGWLVYGLRDQLDSSALKITSLVAPNWHPDSFVTWVVVIALAIFAAVALAALHSGSMSGKWAALAAELVALVVVGFVSFQVRGLTAGYRLNVRNFYGALRVRDSGTPQDFGATRTLTHGTINHGEQFLFPTRRDLPTTYYGPNTGIGVAIQDKQQSGHALRVGVIGLGTGTLSAYGRLGDYYRFYEINPLVLRLSTGDQFSFLPDCKGKVEVAMGDARLSLEREAPENFDVLAVDAFSSDSIPVHLLTYEAMQVFFRHLKDDGILAVHISNRYLDLQPVVAGLTAKLGKTARVFDTDDDDSQDVFGATWVLVTTHPDSFDANIIARSTAFQTTRTVRLWTDDYSNLFQILK